MRQARALTLVLLVFAGWLGGAQPSAAQTSVALGWEGWWLNDPGCPCNPDAWSIYIVYGYPDGSGGYVITGKAFAGNTTYLCSYGYVQGNFASSPYWQECGSQCECVGRFLGTGCVIHGIRGDDTNSCSGWNDQ